MRYGYLIINMCCNGMAGPDQGLISHIKQILYETISRRNRSRRIGLVGYLSASSSTSASTTEEDGLEYE